LATGWLDVSDIDKENFEPPKKNTPFVTLGQSLAIPPIILQHSSGSDGYSASTLEDLQRDQFSISITNATVVSDHQSSAKGYLSYFAPAS